MAAEYLKSRASPVVTALSSPRVSRRYLHRLQRDADARLLLLRQSDVTYRAANIINYTNTECRQPSISDDAFAQL